jgi:putative SOS response-associated peptidase YedK
VFGKERRLPLWDRVRCPEHHPGNNLASYPDKWRLQGRMGLMCGRYVMSKATGDLLSHFEAKEVEGSPPPPSWNVAPTQACRSLPNVLMRARLIGSKLLNARSESILEKPSLRKRAVKRRAIVPAEGYYEWQKTDDGKKIPNYLYSEKEPLLGFAGLYEWRADPSVPGDDPGRWLHNAQKES